MIILHLLIILSIVVSILFFHLIMTFKFENTLHDLDFSGCGFESAEGSPIVNDKTSSNNIRSSVDSTSAKGDLQQVGEFVKLFDCSLGMDETSVVTQDTICSDKHVVGD